ncbi:exodeoxyribonuclease III activity protein, partial [Homalodisca vitripennis]
LTNENLEVQRPFDENVFKLIVYFMERLEKPICLVAHNGNKFDFPILQSELLKINKEFSDDLYCVDSLPGFREVLTRSHNREENAICGIKPLNDTNTMTAATLVPKCDWSCEEYDQELDQVTELAEKFTQEDKSLDSDKLDRKIQMEMQRIRAINENTPQRKSRKSATCQPINLPNVRRKILNDQQPRNFELKSIYESTTKRECLNSHRAEADALALLECVTAVGRPILEWMDSKRIPFKSIKKRW